MFCVTAADTTTAAVQTESSLKESPTVKLPLHGVFFLGERRGLQQTSSWGGSASPRTANPAPPPRALRGDAPPARAPCPRGGGGGTGRPHLPSAHQPQELLLPLLVAQVRRLPAAGALREHTLTAPARGAGPEQPLSPRHSPPWRLRPPGGRQRQNGGGREGRGLACVPHRGPTAASRPATSCPPPAARQPPAPRPFTSGEAARLRPWWPWESRPELIAAAQ